MLRRRREEAREAVCWDGEFSAGSGDGSVGFCVDEINGRCSSKEGSEEARMSTEIVGVELLISHQWTVTKNKEALKKRPLP
jgi:hypothetical protein